ncbi:MAG: chalcone isomerase family protein [Rhodoferax sp.]|nr:chalcone isomerase family protein [Rhodoferax sp.]
MMRHTTVNRRDCLHGLLALGATSSTFGAVAQAQVVAEPQVAQPPELLALPAPWPQANRVGTGRLRYFGLSIYDAALWATPGLAASSYASALFALELRYLRNLSGSAIAERSLDEMRRGGALAPATEALWLRTMRTIFPDVQSGDRITGVNLPQQGVRFYVNGQPRNDVNDAAFGERFFGMWLAPWTSEPGLRTALLAGLTP